MSDVSMIDELRTRNEVLARELADSCREMVEYQFAYRELRDRMRALERALTSVLVEHHLVESNCAVHEHVNLLVEAQLQQDKGHDV